MNTSSGLPAAARAVLVLAALLCAWAALRSLRRCRPAAVTAVSWSRPVMALLEIAIVWSAPLAARSRLLRRPGNDASLTRSLAVAPDCLVARLLPAPVGDQVGAAFAGLRACCLAAGILVATMVVLAFGTLALPLTAMIGVLSWRAGDLLLARAGRNGRRAIVVGLPMAVELLALAVEGGTSLERGVASVACHVRRPLDEVLRRAGRRIALGEAPHVALVREAERTDVAALAALAAVIDRSQRLGTPLVEPLRAIADSALAAARAATLAHAGTAVPVASLLTGLVIAPASVVALIIALLGGGFGQLGGVL